jgi:hypothetical protein
MLAATVAGCGSSSMKTIPKADWIKRADAICAGATKTRNAIPFPRVNPASATKAQLQMQIGPYLAKLIPSQQSTHDQVAALPSPDSGKATITGALANVQKSIDQFKALTRSANAGDVATFRKQFAALNAPSSPGNAASAQVKAFGLKVCGQQNG